MGKKVVTMESKIIFANQSMTPEQFANKFMEPEHRGLVLDILDTMLEQGKIQLDIPASKEKDVIEQAIMENALKVYAKEIKSTEEAAKDKRVEIRNENLLKHKAVEIDFSSSREAETCQKYCMNKLRLKGTTIMNVDGKYTLTLHDITDFDLKKVNNFYNLNRGTAMLLAGAEKTQGAITDTFDHTLNQVVMPVADIGIKAGAKILSSLGTAGVKTAASAVNAAAEGLEKTKNDILNDDDIIKAAANLMETKHSFAQRFGKKRAIGGSSFRVIDGD